METNANGDNDSTGFRKNIDLPLEAQLQYLINENKRLKEQIEYLYSFILGKETDKKSEL